MSKKYIPLDAREEAAYAKLHELHGYNAGICAAIDLVERELGKMHKVAVDLRIELLASRTKITHEFQQTEAFEALQDKLFKRLD